MKEEYINIKVWLRTRRKLRLIAAKTDKSMIATVDRLADQELQRKSISIKDSDSK